MSMSNTEGNTPPDIGMLKIQSPRPEWANDLGNSNDPHCEKVTHTKDQNYNVECYFLLNN